MKNTRYMVHIKLEPSVPKIATKERDMFKGAENIIGERDDTRSYALRWCVERANTRLLITKKPGLER